MDSQPGMVPSSPIPGSGVPAAAAAALADVLNAPTVIAQMLRFADLQAQVGDYRAAIFDGACDRVVPLRAFARCLAAARTAHNATNCRWATTSDMPYPRYPTITDCWRTA